MRWRYGRVSRLTLTGLAFLALVFMAGVERFKVQRKSPHYKSKVQAAELALRAHQVIKEGRVERGLPIDVVNDPSQTGLIGPQYSLITTDRASLRDKLTALNPNFAAVLVEMLWRARVRQGDTVGIALTGAFPALNAALLAAVETLGAKPVIITSIGSSSWGASDPSYTWLDMESLLVERGVFRHRSVAASLGGGGDRGKGLSPRGRELIREAIERNGLRSIEAETLEKSIALRMAIYDSLCSSGSMKAFVNIGGGLASLGSSQNGKLIPPGLTKRLGRRNFPHKGVSILMADQGVPIIHLLEIHRLAQMYDLPIAPDLLPMVGAGSLFSTIQYSVPLTMATLIFYMVITFVIIRFDMKHHRSR